MLKSTVIKNQLQNLGEFDTNTKKNQEFYEELVAVQ